MASDAVLLVQGALPPEAAWRRPSDRREVLRLAHELRGGEARPVDVQGGQHRLGAEAPRVVVRAQPEERASKGRVQRVCTLDERPLRVVELVSCADAMGLPVQRQEGSASLDPVARSRGSVPDSDHITDVLQRMRSQPDLDAPRRAGGDQASTTRWSTP